MFSNTKQNQSIFKKLNQNMLKTKVCKTAMFTSFQGEFWHIIKVKKQLQILEVTRPSYSCINRATMIPKAQNTHAEGMSCDSYFVHQNASAVECGYDTIIYLLSVAVSFQKQQSAGVISS